MARAGEFDILVVREIDRLSRSLAKQLIVEEELKRCGVQVEYVLGDYPDTPEGNLMKNVRAVIAEYERLKIAERMTRGRRLKVMAGHVLVHSTPPYGYQVAEVDGKTTLAMYEREARTVRLIYNWYVHGDENNRQPSMQAIARKLTQLTVPTRLDTNSGQGGYKKRGYGEWNRTTVAKILDSEVYRGTWYYGKSGGKRETWLAVSVPPIVDADLWEAAQKQRRRNRDQARRNRKHRYLLTGRIRCGQCSARVNGHPNRWRSKNATGLNLYYRCRTSRSQERRTGVTCELPQFPVDQVDTTAWEYVKSLLTDPATLVEGLRMQQAERQQDNAPLHERLAVVNDLLADNQRQLGKLLDLYLVDDFPKEMLTERRVRLETTIAALEQERHDLVAQVEAATLSDGQIATIEEFAQRVAQGLKAAEKDFEARQQIIEVMDVQVILTVEEGKKVAYIRCLVDESRQCLESTNIHAHSEDG